MSILGRNEIREKITSGEIKIARFDKADLADSLKTLTSDVHGIRRIADDAIPWLKVIGWILGVAGVSAVGWVVVELLQGFFGAGPGPGL